MTHEFISIDTLEENKKLLGEVERLRNEKQELLETIDMITSDASEYVKRIDKVKELIENDYFEDGSFKNYDKVMSLLNGEDNE